VSLRTAWLSSRAVRASASTMEGGRVGSGIVVGVVVVVVVGVVSEVVVVVVVVNVDVNVDDVDDVDDGGDDSSIFAVTCSFFALLGSVILVVLEISFSATLSASFEAVSSTADSLSLLASLAVFFRPKTPASTGCT